MRGTSAAADAALLSVQYRDSGALRSQSGAWTAGIILLCIDNAFTMLLLAMWEQVAPPSSSGKGAWRPGTSHAAPV